MKRIWKSACFMILAAAIFYVGYRVGTLRLSHDVIVYDSPAKVRRFWEQLEHLAINGGISNYPQYKNALDKKEAMIEMLDLEDMSPLVTYGTLILFGNKNRDAYSVCELYRNAYSVRELGLTPIAEYRTNADLTKRMNFASKVEKGWEKYRVEYIMQYSKDGCYEQSGFLVYNKTGNIVRSYFDTDGDGLFDRMDIFDSDKNLKIKYTLNGLSYEKTGEGPYKHLVE